MSIICNWDDVLPARVVIPAGRAEDVAQGFGAFGNGMRIIDSGTGFAPADWSSVRFIDEAVPFDGTKYILSALCKMSYVGNDGAQFSLFGVGLWDESFVTNLNAGAYGLVIMDGRNGSTGTSTAYQIRSGSVGSGSVVYNGVAASGDFVASAFYRLELEIQTTAGANTFTLLARWYRHDSNVLQHSASTVLAKPAAGIVVRPCVLTYRQGNIDSVQVQRGTEEYMPNLPTRVWNGSAWVTKLMRRDDGKIIRPRKFPNGVNGFLG